MQSNVCTYFVDCDFPDSWVELYNASLEPVDVRGYALGLEGDGSDRFTFDVDSVIAPGGYVIICCDKTGVGLHTDFRIDSGKGDVCLFFNGVLKEKISLKKQPAPDISFGRVSDADSSWGYQWLPTPGGANAGVVESSDLLPSPLLTPSAIITQPQNIVITWPSGYTPHPDARLCATFDGRTPTLADSLPAIPYVVRADSNIVVRAGVIHPGRLSPTPVASSFIYKERNTELSILSIITDPAYLYDKEIGIMTDGQTEEQYELYHYNKWRRPMHLQLFAGPGHSSQFSQLAEGRVHGSLSRDNKQKSLCVYANKRFGEKRFNTQDIWHHKPKVKEVKSMVIRNAGQDTYTRMADAYAQTLAAQAYPDLEWQDNHPIVVYINGKYYGHYNLRERSDEDWFESNRNTENVDIIENYNEIVTGDSTAFHNLHQIITSPNMDYDELNKIIDIDNWLFVLAYNTYGNNVDFPFNNFRIWRPREENAKWRVMLKDMDFWFGRWTYGFESYFDFIDSCLDPDSEYGYVPEVNILQYLINSPATAEKFADTLTFLCGDIAAPEVALKLYHSMLNTIKDEYEPTVRFNFTPEQAEWLLSVVEYQRYTRFVGFLRNRPLQIAQQVSKKYNWGEPCFINFDHDTIPIKFNNIPLINPTYNGYYYCGRNLNIDAGDNFEIVARIKYSDKEENITLNDDNNFIIPYGAQEITFKAYKKGDGVNSLYPENAKKKYYNLQGLPIQTPKKGEYYLELGPNGCKKTILRNHYLK